MGIAAFLDSHLNGQFARCAHNQRIMMDDVTIPLLVPFAKLQSLLLSVVFASFVIKKRKMLSVLQSGNMKKGDNLVDLALDGMKILK